MQFLPQDPIKRCLGLQSAFDSQCHCPCLHHAQDMAGIRVNTEWVCREKEEGKSTCQTLTSLASKHQVPLLVLGSFGRKGEKL